MDPRPGAVDAGGTATGSTAAAPPTTRASTASTSRRWRRCWRAAAARFQRHLAVRDRRRNRLARPGGVLRAAQRDALAADVLIASDGLGCAPRRRRCSWHARRRQLRPAADAARRATIRQLGRAAAQPPARCWRRPLPAWWTAAAASQVPECGRRIHAGQRARRAGRPGPGGEADDPVDADWGEPGLTPIERVLAWNALEVLAMRTGNP